MNNFRFLSSTQIIFGKDVENAVGAETAKYAKKILLHYGGGSIIKSGLYDRVIKSLKEAGIEYIELGGVKANPRLSLVYEGIKICRENNINFILAVGGGSVIDSAKAISCGVPYEGDVWDFYIGKDDPRKAIPVGVILTIPAAGSESSLSSVITNEDGMLKRSIDIDVVRPVFAFMNPVLSYTLPPYQTACGASDIMAHIMERYFTQVKDVELTDRMCEAVLKTVINNTPVVLEKPEDYAARSEIMWAGSLAHNDLLSTGRTGDWASHLIEHELSGLNDVAHGAGLSVIFPAWMKYVYKHDVQRFVQFAVRVWNVEQNFENPEKTVLDGIEKLTEFYKSIGLPTTLGEIGITEKNFDEIASKCRMNDQGTVGNFVKLTKEDVVNILKLAK